MSEGLIEGRQIYKDGGLCINVAMFEDNDTKPDEYDCYSAEDLTAWSNDEWRYVGLVATVQFQGVPIGTDSLWGIEHGSLAEVEADAWEWQPTETRGDVTYMGSRLFHVANEAMDDAWRFVQRLTGGALPNRSAPIVRALRTTEPIRHDEIDEAHAAALVENNDRS